MLGPLGAPGRERLREPSPPAGRALRPVVCVQFSWDGRGSPQGGGHFYFSLFPLFLFLLSLPPNMTYTILSLGFRSYMKPFP